MKDIIDNEPRRHIPAVVLDDYCHVASVSRMAPRSYWHRFENRVQQDTSFALDLLDETGAKATFLSSGWHLFLSRRLSPFYRFVLHQKLAMHTSCFPVYRASAIKNISLGWEGFIGIRQILSQLDMNGRGVVEGPAAMDGRSLRHSKMSNPRTMRGQFALLAHLMAEQVSRQFRPQQLS